MSEFATVLKTYKGDLGYVERLIPTYQSFNKDCIPLYLVIPKSDYSYFEKFSNSLLRIIVDEELFDSYVDIGDYPEIKTSLGIINAGISKLAFWETGLADNYFAIDSDMVFIRNFYIHDFIDEHQTPYLALSSYSDLKVDPFYYQRYWEGRNSSYENVKKQIGFLTSQNINTHNSQVMSSVILEDFKQNFLIPKGWTYADAMKFECYEFFWYGAWAQKQQKVKYLMRHDFVKMIQHQGEHLMYFDAGFRASDFARDYVGIIINSNWSRQYGIIDFDNPPAHQYHGIGSWALWKNSLKTS